ncbi:septal ring lytic transglycosylase RlpA family protein [Hyphomicrobium sp. D-2]|uniref:septal ring lytic transglycosylase RlpA family protein n=1 Tax=Hyphomicrobium sp. D-2 TaxID=3041621 RepID=UPI00245735EB|nr:septal ring lytic transglycosylase RlpA family protein [Hyphomicrobium sp. D-2]MDH4982065.1 septal ring lytic transglycosylase RlpA family protein [Hyphomicrobium sp. D-2]
MRTFVLSALTVVGFGLTALTPAAAANVPWSCMSPAFACGEATVSKFSGQKAHKRTAKHKKHASRQHSKSNSAKQQAANVAKPERKVAASNETAKAKSATVKKPQQQAKTKQHPLSPPNIGVKPKADAKPDTTKANTAKVDTTKSTHRVVGSQAGMASYYWQPQMTASGVRFNPNAMTAAHRSLPFGTKVRVTNKRNGKSVVVTINDRGPFIKGRIIDLSNAAAGVIGMRASGVAPVVVERLTR